MRTEKSDAPQTVADYLARLSADHRKALEILRKTIQSVAPRAEECISYGIPTFRLDGKPLVSFGAATKHCAFYPGAHPLRVHASELAGYSIGKGTIRFTPERPLPTALVRKLVKTRIAERTEDRLTTKSANA